MRLARVSSCLLAIGLALCIGPPAQAGERGPSIQLYSAFGSPTRFTVRGRVFKKSGEDGKAGSALAKNLRRLFTNEEWKGAELSVMAAGLTRSCKADDEGLFEAVFETGEKPLPPGEQPLRVEVAGGAVAAEGRVRIVGPDELVIVSDFDDTVAISKVTEKPAMIGIALARDEKSQAAVPGMARLYRCLREGQGGKAVFVYLSGSPIQYFGRSKAFLHEHGYPEGQMLLRHLDANTLDGSAFKGPWLERLLEDLPQSRFVFVGDSGEKDPEVYAAAAKTAGGRAVATFIRLVEPEHRAGDARYSGMRAFRDAKEAEAAARELGLIEEGCEGQ